MQRTTTAQRAPSAIVLAIAGAVALVVACGGGGDGPRVVPTPVPSPTQPGTSPEPTVRPTPTQPASTATPSGTPPGLPPLRLAPVATGLEQPLFVTAAPGDASRLFVVEQTGRIRVVRDGTLLAAPFVDLSDRISCCGERGLLGLAFDPDYAASGRLFVNYTNADGDTEVVELARTSDPDVASPEIVRRFFTVEQPFPNHNGGMLAFGPDGYLYVGLGDGGAAGDPQDNGQNPDVKLGKILRIDVDTYPTPPPGNAPGGDPDVWALGLRNPWRFSFDRQTGDLYIGDVGQNALEEIDVAPSGAAGLNFGWRIMEASQCFQPRTGCDTSGLTLPVVEYGRDTGCSITGGHVYRGSALPELAGVYLYGDYCSNRVFSFRLVDGVAQELRELTADLDPGDQIQGLTSFGEDAAGEILVVSHSGSVFRIEAE